MAYNTKDLRNVVLLGHSGSGKTTIVRHLLGLEHLNLEFSISATSREPRGNEIDGKDYHFLDNETFREKIAKSEFIEWEEVYKDKLYGTLHSEVERIRENQKKIIFDIEVNGAQSIKSKYGDQCLVIFVKPPSFRVLVSRLQNRNTETADSFKKRVMRIKKELLFENAFDLVLLNDKLEETLLNAEQIIEEYVL